MAIRLVTRSPCNEPKTGFYGGDSSGFYDGGFFGEGGIVPHPHEPVVTDMLNAFNRLLFNRRSESGDNDGSSG